MSEEADNSTSTTAPVAAAAPPAPVVAPPPAPARPNKLTQVVAWVGIVAGITFVVAVIFFSGFVLGKHSDGGHHRGGPDRGNGQFHRGGPPMGPPHIFFPGGPGGPGAQGGPGFQQGPQQGQAPGPGNQQGGPTAIPRP